MTRRLLLWLPFTVVAALCVAFFISLRHPDDRVIASQAVGQPLPEFAAPAAFPDRPGAASADFRDGRPRLLNIFASWCVPCRDEMPMLGRLKAAGAEIDGIAVHDSAPELRKFLDQYGDPYARIGLDDQGKTQLAFGSAGVPETFVIDGSGRILYQHIGVVSEEDMPKLLKMLEVRP